VREGEREERMRTKGLGYNTSQGKGWEGSDSGGDVFRKYGNRWWEMRKIWKKKSLNN